MIYVNRRYIGDHHQSLRVVMNGERMIRVVLSKAGRVRCVSSKMLSWNPISQVFRAEFICVVGVGIPYTNASDVSTALFRTFSAGPSSK